MFVNLFTANMTTNRELYVSRTRQSKLQAGLLDEELRKQIP